MPTISRFYGIEIQMYWNDKHGPHFHAIYGEHRALISLVDGEVLRGGLPPRATRITRQWSRLHHADLLENWERARRSEQLKQIEALK